MIHVELVFEMKGRFFDFQQFGVKNFMSGRGSRLGIVMAIRCRTRKRAGTN